MLLFADLPRYVPRYAESKGLTKAFRCIAVMLLHPGWHAVFNFRLAQLLRRLKLLPISWLVYRWNMFVFCTDMHPVLKIGPRLWLPHPFGIVIARDAVLGSDCTVYQHATIGGRGDPPLVGDRVMIGAGACIIGPARVGSNVQIGANAVVVEPVPDGVTVAGVPARVVSKGAGV